MLALDIVGQQLLLHTTRWILQICKGTRSFYMSEFVSRANLVIYSYSKRVFLLGPAHHEYIDGCSLSQFDLYETPFGNLQLDKKGGSFYFICTHHLEISNGIVSIVLKEIYETGKFNWMSQNVDEDEHSIELHLPFVYKIFEKYSQVFSALEKFPGVKRFFL